jgi:hypothetical protein
MGYAAQDGLAQSRQNLAPPQDSAGRIERLESSLQSVIDENARLSLELENLHDQLLANASSMDDAGTAMKMQGEYASESPETMESPYFATYDKGISIQSKDPKRFPYSLRINHQTAFRYTGFVKESPSWVDSSGNTNLLFNSSDFAIPRGRLIFSGNTLLPDLSYLLNVDYNTVNNNPIGFRAYALSYRFSRSMEVHLGQNKVPGSREWLHSSFDAQAGPDRSMATTFFRPSLSQGIWFTGQPIDRLYYHAMVSNGFNTLNVRQSELNDRFCVSESTWWEPWGDFGRGYSDLENHQELTVRLGSSLTVTKEEGSQSSEYAENTLIRLSDGTLATQAGALAPGVTLQSFYLNLQAIDLAFKYRGISLSTEIYRQGLTGLQGNGPLPLDALHTYGGVAQVGNFIIPQKFELYTRYSFVTGKFGSGSEIAGGLNWFLLRGKSNLRYTLDTAWLDSSPADQNRTGFLAGQSGFLARTQVTSSF